MISRRSSILAALRFFTCLFAGSSFTWAPSSRRGPAPLRVASTKKITAATDHELTLGAPRDRPSSSEYTTRGGVLVNVAVNTVQNPDAVIERMVDALDSRLGALFASSYEFPGRYARWTLGFVNPPLRVTGRDRSFAVTALNGRGKVLLAAVQAALTGHEHVSTLSISSDEAELKGTVKEISGYFPEEERSKQPSLFSVVRAITDMFAYEGDPQLGLYGSFGYDLTFQFEPIKMKHDRDEAQRDLVLFLPDQIIVVDTKKNDAWELRYDFVFTDEVTKREHNTNWQAREGCDEPFEYLPVGTEVERRDTPPGEFSKKVDIAKEEFKVGNLFEAVLSQTFAERCSAPPSTLFRRLRTRNPAPYGFLLNLGQQEYLVGASPEMFVRCEAVEGRGLRVETCPISGTIARGANALEDAQRIKAILGNPKEESELTMCTDVDRNDKSRICVPGSVKVVGRRQIEMYSKLIHTVDHVEGFLRPGFDALDAFLCHTWAVTVTGAPKTWAMRFVEEQEASPREWYGGAVGLVGFDGHLNTGLTLRTVHVKKGVGTVRAGATLLYDSDPLSEERETELKASAMLDALVRADVADDDNEDGRSDTDGNQPGGGVVGGSEPPKVPKVLLVDHEDSFVHTLANYLRQTGAEVVTCRSGKPAMAVLDSAQAFLDSGDDSGGDNGDGSSSAWVPDLVVLSPGPGNPKDFDLSKTLAAVEQLGVPCFGVCLGLQGMCEHFGGTLGVLDYPMHGKPSAVTLAESYLSGGAAWPVFQGLPPTFEVARYHSLHALPDLLPDCLRVTALTDDGVVMALEHKTLPFAAVQFHPESILTNPSHGLTILSNCLRVLKSPSAKNFVYLNH